MTKYDKIVSEKMELEEKLRKLKSEKAQLEDEVFITFGKVYMDRRELKLDDFVGIEKEQLEELIYNIVNDEINFDDEGVNYNHNND